VLLPLDPVRRPRLAGRRLPDDSVVVAESASRSSTENLMHARIAEGADKFGKISSARGHTQRIIKSVRRSRDAEACQLRARVRFQL
jgi:hypothetical protein